MITNPILSIKTLNIMHVIIIYIFVESILLDLSLDIISFELHNTFQG